MCCRRHGIHPSLRRTQERRAVELLVSKRRQAEALARVSVVGGDPPGISDSRRSDPLGAICSVRRANSHMPYHVRDSR